MEELCERLDARAAKGTPRGGGGDGGGGGGPSTSGEMSGGDSTMETPEESDEVREKHKQLLAEIRSCFRLLSIHTRLSGSESPRTRRISTQTTDNCESLHFLASNTDRHKGSGGCSSGSPRGEELRGLTPTEDAQNSLLYNQLIIGSSASTHPNENCSIASIVSDEDVAAAALHGRGALPPSDRYPVGGEGSRGKGEGEEDEDDEPCCESIHQRAMVNPTSRLKTVINLSKLDVIRVVEWLYRDHPGAVWRAASRKAMGDRNNCRYLIYGEISFVAFAKLLEQYAPPGTAAGSPLSSATASAIASPGQDDDSGIGEKQQQHDGEEGKGKKLVNSGEGDGDGEDVAAPVGFTFYDLGCGAGRPVYMASLLHTNCTKSCGVEIVPDMHEMNKVLFKLYSLEVHPNLHPVKQIQRLDFICGDFLQIDWSDADMIFTNATCFGDPLFQKFEERAVKVLKPGTVVISVTRPFINLLAWELLERQERRMSWAPAVVYVYRKRSPEAAELDALVSRSESSIAHEQPLSPEPIRQPERNLETEDPTTIQPCKSSVTSSSAVAP